MADDTNDQIGRMLYRALGEQPVTPSFAIAIPREANAQPTNMNPLLRSMGIAINAPIEAPEPAKAREIAVPSDDNEPSPTIKAILAKQFQADRNAQWEAERKAREKKLEKQSRKKLQKRLVKLAKV